VKAAVLSIGTNSTRVLLADLSAPLPLVLLSRSTGTRIGESLRERGMLGDEPMRRTLQAARDHIAALDGAADRIYVIATSALRRAQNASTFARNIEAIAGAPLYVLSGEEEAVASYRGARCALPDFDHARTGVADIGGGSSEFAAGSGVLPDSIASCEMGAVRLSELVPALTGALGVVDERAIERARGIARGSLAPMLDVGRIDRLAFVGGTATTAAALLRGSVGPDAATLSRAEVRTLFDRLCTLSHGQRRALAGMNPQRADIIVAGLLLLESVFELSDMHDALVTTSDVLLGYLLIRSEADR
jgi:exopolyphosphatase/guanosine-5'-triphosphate,3'-diphosphate pyrophosphatase